MASIPKEVENLGDFLKCSICLETFKKPKSLPCLHTFCEACLREYINSENSHEVTASEETKSKVEELTSAESKVQCPTCRNVVQMEKGESKGAWLEKLPKNFFVISLLDKQSIKDKSKMCDPCTFDGKKEIALSWCVNCSEALCQQCQEYHKKFKAFQNHAFLDLNLVKTQNATSSICGFIPCSEHPSSQAQVFCRDHRDTCCTLCATVRHRNCSEISTLEEAAKGVKNDKRTLDLGEKLDELRETLQNRIFQNRELLDNLKTSKETVEKESSALVHDAIQHLTKLETTFHSELQENFKRNLSALDCEFSRLSNLLSTVMHQKHLLTASMAEGSNEECLVERESILGRENEIRSDSEKVKTDSSLATMLFTFNPKLKELTTLVTSLGSFSKKNRMQNGKINLLKHHKLCGGVCCAVFYQKNILITDYIKKQILVVDDSLSCKYSIVVKGHPRDITVDGLGRVFVSLPSEREILEVDIVTKTERKFFSTSVKCLGLLWCKETFFITSGSVIEMYSDDGIKQKEIECHDTWMMGKTPDGKLVYPQNDSITENSLLHNKKRKIFTRSGAGFRGIDTDDKGNIYTVGMDNRALYQLTSEGRLLQEVNMAELGLLRLWKVSLNDKNNILITTANGDVALFEVKCEEL